VATGSSADNIVSHFAVNYHNEAQALGIDLNELYAALKADGEDNPFEWNTEGRQVNVYQCGLVLSRPKPWSDFFDQGIMDTYRSLYWMPAALDVKHGREVEHSK
jgi:hypothetical protein